MFKAPEMSQLEEIFSKKRFIQVFETRNHKNATLSTFINDFLD